MRIRRTLHILIFLALLFSLMSFIAFAETQGHIWGPWVVNKTPTCTLAGEKYQQCDKLPNYPHWRYKSLPPLGHNYGSWMTVKKATQTKEGLIERVCKNDSSHVITKTIPKLKKMKKLKEAQPKVTPVVKEKEKPKPKEKPMPNTLDYVLSSIFVGTCAGFFWAIRRDYNVVKWSDIQKSKFM